MLAQKMIDLRHKHGLSQDDLSEIIDVSRLTIDKWEKGEKTPDMDQVKRICTYFKIPMKKFIGDYLEHNTEDKDMTSLTYNGVMTYVEDQKKVSSLISKGVFICITSVAPLLLLLALSGAKYIDMTSNLATATGLAILFGMIAFAVGIFIRSNNYSFDFEVSDRYLLLQEGVKKNVKDIMDDYRNTYTRNITFSVLLILMSTIPLISVAILVPSDFLSLMMVIVKLLMIAIGVSIIIPTSMHFNTLKAITQIGDPKCVKTRQERRTEKVAAFYWPLVTAVYIGWSLWTMAWGTTWIIWPVSGIVFVTIVGLLALFDKDE